MQRFLLTALLSLVPLSSAASQSPPSDDTERPAHRSEDGRPPRPDLSETAATLGVSEEDLHAALIASGGPPPDFAKAAETLSIDEATLKAAMPPPPRRQRSARPE